MLADIALPAGQAGSEMLCLFIGMIYLAALFIGGRLEFLADGSLIPAGIASAQANPPSPLFKGGIAAAISIDFFRKIAFCGIDLTKNSSEKLDSIMHFINNYIKLFYVYYVNFKLLGFGQKNDPIVEN
jgi:hypothetical protein